MTPLRVYRFETTVDDEEISIVAGDTECGFSRVFFRLERATRLRFFNDLCRDHVIRLDEPGSYELVIDPADSQTGTYSFTVTR